MNESAQMNDVDGAALILEEINLSKICTDLVNRGVLSDRSVAAYLEQKELWHRPFLLEITAQGKEATRMFLEVLVVNDYENVALALQKKLGITDSTDDTSSLNVDAFNHLNLDDETAPESTEPIDYIDTVEPDGNCASCITKSDETDQYVNSSDVQNGASAIVVKSGKEFYSPDNLRIYRMGSKPKGFALIIVNQDFPGMLYETRNGALRDQSNLINLFKGLGYIVHDYFNKDSMEMRKIFRRFAQLHEHASVDSCVVAISSHGECNRIVGTDNEYVWMEDILDMFNNQNCPLLKNKPKLFFVQACRGRKFDAGVSNTNVADGRPTSLPNRLLQPTQRSASWTDMTIAYSTIAEYVAIRNKIHGSWFIVAVTQIFKNYAWNTPLSKLFQLVTDLMESYQDHNGEKQVPEVVHRGWKKDLYFNPGLYQIDG